MRRMPSLLVGLAALAGCYLSHERDPAPVSDGGRRDAGGPGVSEDAGSLDAGVLECDGIAIGPSIALDTGGSGVTPRLAALPGGDVGVVYVLPGVGSPTRIIYERLSARLEPITGPVVIANDSFTWAEPVVAEGELAIAFGVAGDRASRLEHVTLDGVMTRPRDRVDLYHPAILRASASGLFWVAFAMRTDNALEIAHVGRDAELLHPFVRIELGRYGSGHGAVARPDRRSHILTYPREGPPGVRNGWITAIDERGALEPERLLGDDGDSTVLPVLAGGTLAIVRHGDDALFVERTDIESLARLERSRFDPLPGRLLAASVGDRLVVVHADSGTFTADDFGPTFARFDRARVPLPVAGLTGAGSAIELPGAAIFALGLADGARTFPWLVRIECTP
jgi:hypothetical protein